VLEIQAASNNTIKGGLTGDPTDRQALVDIVTAGGRPLLLREVHQETTWW
jgi:mannose-6-phosphate isomerase class I